MHNMESFSHNLANQMLTILNTLNQNIVNLGGMLKSSGHHVEKNEKDKANTRIKEEIMDATNSFFDWACELNQELLVEEN